MDYKNGARGLPPSNVLLYELVDGAWLCVRPSGTEPKLKLYFGVRGNTAQEAEALASAMMADAQKNDGRISKTIMILPALLPGRVFGHCRFKG